MNGLMLNQQGIISSQVFSPGDIDGLTVWADFSDPSRITDSDGVPITLTDNAGFARLYLNPASVRGAAGSYFNVTGALNYRSSIYSYPCAQGSTGYLVLKNADGSDDTSFRTSPQVSAIGLFAYTNSNAFDYVFTVNQGFAAKTFYMMMDTRSINRLGFAISGVGSNYFANAAAWDNSLTKRLMSLQCAGEGGYMRAWKNGAFQSQVLTPSGDGGFYNAAGRLGWNVGYPGGGSGATRYLYSLLVYDRMLDDTEIGQINDFVLSQYGML